MIEMENYFSSVRHLDKCMVKRSKGFALVRSEGVPRLGRDERGEGDLLVGRSRRDPDQPLLLRPCFFPVLSFQICILTAGIVFKVFSKPLVRFGPYFYTLKCLLSVGFPWNCEDQRNWKSIQTQPWYLNLHFDRGFCITLYNASVFGTLYLNWTLYQDLKCPKYRFSLKLWRSKE